MEWSSIYERVSTPGPGFARARGGLSFRNLSVVLLLAATTAELSAQSSPPPLFEDFPRHMKWMNAGRRTEAIGDVNGNGFPDMAIPRGDWILLLLNRGDGTFAETRIPANGRGADSLRSFNARFGDINGNGRLDLVALTNYRYIQPERYGFGIAIFLGDGKGGFVETPPGHLIPDDLQRSGIMELADVTGNGACDIYLARPNPDWPDVLYLNDGRGFFRNVSSTHLPGYAPNNYPDIYESVFADLTGNGFPDLVLACGPEFPEINRVYLNDGTGRFLNVVYLGTIPDATWCVAVGDVTGDGRPDIVFGNDTRANRYPDTLYLNQGNGVFLNATDRLPRDQDLTRSIAMGDINGNGHLDIVAVDTLFRGVRIYLNDGTGRFPTDSRDLVRFRVGNGFWYVRLVDFDGDGDLDLFVSNSIQRYWLMNLTRHLYTQETVELGGSLTYTFYGAPMQHFFPVLSLMPARISLPGLGTLGLDPTAMLVLPPEMIPPGEHIMTTTLSLPADPALRGVNLYSQAFVVDLANPANTRLTNWLSDRLQ